MLQAQCLPTQDDLTQIAWQVAQAYQLVTPRAPCLYQQVIHVSGPPGRVYQAVRQLPTPSPDVIQRIYVVQPGRDLIDLVIQGAQAPAPVYQDQTVWQASQPPTIYPRVVQPAQSCSFSSTATSASVTPFASVMPTMSAFPVGMNQMPMAAYQTPMMYGANAMPPFVANTSQFPVAYGTRAFPRVYPSRRNRDGRSGTPFF